MALSRPCRWLPLPGLTLLAFTCICWLVPFMWLGFVMICAAMAEAYRAEKICKEKHP
ncbi:hypothetical protein [Acidithiobacillus ferrivorans]|jgi:hypothetical protein|uniref:hypothetical protein n=1 Tax=Acidithiobacillus ferrivorans TaxID=160808 RepID=UPI001681B97C|nr:hypothetical protein [Acidithiobacillus ferrivorans]